MINKKISTILAFSVVIILAIFLAGISFYLWRGVRLENNSVVSISKKNKNIACTEEAKICPDGSVVSRIAPSCKFASCPNENNSQKQINISNWQKYENEAYGFELTLLSGWEEYATSIVFGPKNATQISFELPTNDADWLKNNGSKKTAAVFNLTIYPISSNLKNDIPNRREIKRNGKYVVFYDRIDKITDYPEDFKLELFAQADEIIKTFKFIN